MKPNDTPIDQSKIVLQEESGDWGVLFHPETSELAGGEPFICQDLPHRIDTNKPVNFPSFPGRGEGVRGPTTQRSEEDLP